MRFESIMKGLLTLLVVTFLLASTPVVLGQRDEAHIRVIVNMVQLNVAVTDNKGNYISGLRPDDFAVVEDGIPQKLATFAEGNEPTRSLISVASNDAPSAGSIKESRGSGQGASAGGSPETLGSIVAGANVFILFDTSNYMYRGFVFAQDAIADFIRSLETANRIAFYSYSRDLSRASALTADRSQVIRGVRSTVAGDDAALYNCLLLTIKDAAQYQGRKVVVVFSNGPDNSSIVPPEDAAELAQSTGIERMTAATGGKAYFAKNWREEKRAFASIRDDLAHLYSLSYYPQPNPNRGWRAIKVKLVGEHLKKYNIRTRNGYRPLPARFSAENAAASVDSAPE